MSLVRCLLSTLSLYFLLSLVSLSVYANRIELVDGTKVFYPAQEVTVRFSTKESSTEVGRWWVGVFNKGETNLRRYLAYTYLNRAINHTVKIKLPTKVGEYELLLATDNYDAEKADNRIALTVSPISAENITLSIDSSTVKPGEKFTVQFRAAVPLSKSAWVGIFAADLPYGQNHSYASYRYVKKQALLTFVAPKKEGDYELRFMDADPGNQVLALPLVVSASDNQTTAAAPARENAAVDQAASKKAKADKLLNNIKKLASKGKSERDIRKAAWAVKAKGFSPLQDADVDRLIATQKQVTSYMDSSDKKPNKEQEAIMRNAAFAGELYNVFPVILKGQPELVRLESIAKKNGYNNFQQFADHADRMQKIFMAVPWVLMSRDMVFGDQPKPEPIDNLLAYLQDESKPKADREKMTGQLYDLLGDYKTNKADVAFVSKHYAKFKPVFNL